MRNFLGIFVLVLESLTIFVYATEEPLRPRFYMYDWPHLVNRYANFTDRDHRGHGVEFPQWTQNFGAGRVIDRKNLEFKTSQFSLFKIMYERALLDKKNKALSPETAVSYFIPYDFGMDATFFEANGRMRQTKCPLASNVTELLQKSPYFQAKQGHDHILIVSVNQNMNYFFNAGPCKDFLRFCWNCTKLAIDEYMFIAKNRKLELMNKGINWHAIPFPSDYHYDSAPSSKDIFSTVAAAVTTLTAGGDSGNIDYSEPPWARDYRNKSTFISFMGNPRKFSPISTQIREALIIQCNNTAHSRGPEYCKFGLYSHDIQKGGGNGMMRDSVFCLQPPGDMPTRKSLFDSILSGCIPVLFHPLTGKYMYEWHWSQQEWDEAAVHFDTIDQIKSIINQTLDAVKFLVDIKLSNPEFITAKQEKLKEIAFQMQYSLIHQNVVTGAKKVAVRMRHGGGSRYFDAYDIAMQNVLAIHSGRGSHNRTTDYLSCDEMLVGGQKIRYQTSDWCAKMHTKADPWWPPAVCPYGKCSDSDYA